MTQLETKLLVPDITGDLIELYRRERHVKPLLAARIAGVTTEQIRNDHAAGRLPKGAGVNVEGLGFGFDVGLVLDHYHGEAVAA